MTTETTYCYYCRRLIIPEDPNEPLKCVAFPDEIPNWIHRGGPDAHKKPVEGDGGKYFVPGEPDGYEGPQPKG